MADVALVIGSSGTLGSRVADHLAMSGWRVLRCSRQQANLEHSISWAEVFGKNGRFEREVDLLVNCASPNRYEADQDPVGYLEWMQEHGNRLSRLADKTNPRKAVSFSTVHVYGQPSIEFLSEESGLLGRDPYARGHIYLESSLSPAWQILRLSNVFGTTGRQGRLDSTLVTVDFVRQFSQNDRADIRESGITVRDFLPARTMLRYFDKAVHSISRLRTMNVCSGRYVELSEWQTYVWAVAGSWGPNDVISFPSSAPSFGRITSVLGVPDLRTLSEDSALEISQLQQHFDCLNGEAN